MTFLFFAIDYNIKVGFLFSEKRTLEIYHFSPTAPPEDSKQNVPPLLRQKKKSPFFSLIICNVTLSSEKNVQNGCTQPGPSALQNNKWCLYVLPSFPSLLANTSRSIYVSGTLPTYPSPKPTLTLTSHLRQNGGLGKG